MNSCYSSNKVMEEIKCRIKDKFKNQENFGKELGASRKTVSRILNHGTDIVTFFRICKILYRRNINRLIFLFVTFGDKQQKAIKMVKTISKTNL